MPRLFLLALLASLVFSQDRSSNTWSQYLGGSDSSQYSSLKQINKNNVKQLEVAWSYSTSEPYLFNPIVIDGTMYVQAKNNSIVALDAATGRELWAHALTGPVTTRGINYWECKILQVAQYSQDRNYSQGCRNIHKAAELKVAKI